MRGIVIVSVALTALFYIAATDAYSVRFGKQDDDRNESEKRSVPRNNGPDDSHNPSLDEESALSEKSKRQESKRFSKLRSGPQNERKLLDKDRDEGGSESVEHQIADEFSSQLEQLMDVAVRSISWIMENTDVTRSAKFADESLKLSKNLSKGKRKLLLKTAAKLAAMAIDCSAKDKPELARLMKMVVTTVISHATDELDNTLGAAFNIIEGIDPAVLETKGEAVRETTLWLLKYLSAKLHEILDSGADQINSGDDSVSHRRRTRSVNGRTNGGDEINEFLKYLTSQKRSGKSKLRRNTAARRDSITKKAESEISSGLLQEIVRLVTDLSPPNAAKYETIPPPSPALKKAASTATAASRHDTATKFGSGRKAEITEPDAALPDFLIMPVIKQESPAGSADNDPSCCCCCCHKSTTTPDTTDDYPTKTFSPTPPVDYPTTAASITETGKKLRDLTPPDSDYHRAESEERNQWKEPEYDDTKFGREEDK